MLSRFSRAAVGAGIVLGAVSCLEVSLILFDFQHPPAENPLRITGDAVAGEVEPIHQRDPLQIWKPRPGARIPWGDDRVNSAGYRGPLLPIDRTQGRVRIAALGDSSTFGLGVRYEDAWPAQLAAILEAEGIACDVLDAGVIGSTARQGLERWRELVRPYHADVVVAAYGAVNEHVPAMGVGDDEMIRALVLASSPVALWARRLRSDLRILHLLAFARDALTGSGQPGMDEETARLARDWRATVVGRRDWPGRRRVSPAGFERVLRTLRTEVEDEGARLVLLSMPRRNIVEAEQPAVLLYTEALERVAREDGVPLADGRRAFGAAVRRVQTLDELFLDHFHPTPFGHRILAEAVRAALPAEALH